MNVIYWRKVVQNSSLQTTTKAVLLVLANYMNNDGSDCFPSIETIMKGATLSNRAVILHIKKAVEAQFLIKKQRCLKGQAWRRNEYQPRFPDAIKGDDSRSLPKEKGGDLNSKKVVTESHTNRPVTKPKEKEITNVISKKEKANVPISEVEVGHVEAWAAENIPTSLKLAWELGKCRDYWKSTHRKPPKDGVAAFRNWLRKAAEYQEKAPQSARKTATHKDFSKQDYYANTDGFITD